jgi:hypothetical protein
MLAGSERDGLFQQAPHCTGLTELRMAGSIEGTTVDDVRSAGLNAGFVNGNNGQFDTPFVGMLGAGQIGLHLTWPHGLSYGEAEHTSGGTVVPAMGTHAGQELCVTNAAVGFPDGGDEDGAFKFWVRGARAGGCSGVDVPIDLRGCMQ